MLCSPPAGLFERATASMADGTVGCSRAGGLQVLQHKVWSNHIWREDFVSWVYGETTLNLKSDQLAASSS